MVREVMTVQLNVIQPGRVLHEVIVGVFKSQGTTFDAWCDANKVARGSARAATYGQSGGDGGQALLKRIIEGAGAQVVDVAYRTRMNSETARMNAAASDGAGVAA